MNVLTLKKAGIDYENGVARFLGDRELYETVLNTFLSDAIFSRIEAAYMEKNSAALLSSTHELKGVTGNLDMTTLYSATCTMVSLLRSEAYTDEQIDKAYLELKTAYEAAIKGIHDASEV